MKEYYYLGVVDKNKYNEIMNLPQQDGEKTSMLKENTVFNYCLGKINEYVLKELKRNTEKIIESGKTECGLCTCDIFFNLANAYLKMTNKYLNELLEPFECICPTYSTTGRATHGISTSRRMSEEQQTQLKKIFSYIESKEFWTSIPFNKNAEDIEHSNLFEECAFNLFHLHKKIDPENQIVCFWKE